jgi:hypothetical protein
MNFDDMSNELDALKNEQMNKMKNIFALAVRNIFELYPKIQTIYWRQFTTSFNDGDPCYFTIRGFGATTATYDIVDGTYWSDEVYGDSEEDFEIFESYGGEEINKNLRKFEGLLDRMSDFLERDYGGYSFIKLHRDGVEIEEYYE